MNRPIHLKTHSLPWLLATTFALAIAMAAGCSRLGDLAALPPPGTSAGTALGDKAVASKVSAALAGDAAIRDFDIAVSAINGDVRLRGLVDTPARIDRAIRLARGVDGVHTIHDELRLAGEGDMAVPTGTSSGTDASEATR